MLITNIHYPNNAGRTRVLSNAPCARSRSVMKQDLNAFRSRYRASINPGYNAWLHGGFVLGYGLLGLGFSWHLLDRVRPSEWLTIPLAMVFFNWAEYAVHKNLGHHKHRLSAAFYRRHTGDHHGFFVAGR